MPLLLLKKKSWMCLRLNNTQASLCWLHAGNICYSNFATISDYVYWDPVFNADSTGFEVFLLLAFSPTANEQLRDRLQVSGFLRISLWRCPSELGDRQMQKPGVIYESRMSFHSVRPFDLIFTLGTDITHRIGGWLTGKYHRGKVNRTEIKLITFQT